MDWRAAVADNWPYKLAAAALSVLLWFNVTADEQRQEQAVPTRLEVVLEDPAWVATEMPAEVMTTFQGRRGDFFAFALRANRPVIRKEIREVSDSVMRLQLSPGEVVYDRQLEVRPVSVRPSEVRLSFEPVSERRIPVTIDLEAAAAEGFTITGSPVVEPESVTVRGPRSVVAAVSHVESEPVALDEVRETVTRQVSLRLPDGLPSTVLEPEQVLLTLGVDSLAEREFELFVEARGPGEEAVRVDPERVTVTVRGAYGALERLTAEDIEVLAPLEEPAADDREVSVEVHLPEGVAATATAEPATVTVRPTSGEAGAGR